MYSNYSIIIYKVEHNEDYVFHIFRDILSGPNSTFNNLFKGQRIIVIQEHKSQKDNSFRMLPRSTITQQNQKNVIRHTPRMLKYFH